MTDGAPLLGWCVVANVTRTPPPLADGTPRRPDGGPDGDREGGPEGGGPEAGGTGALGSGMG